MRVQLTPEQRRALESCLQALSSNNEAILVGPAGSGKTTLVSHLVGHWPGRVIFLAPTGRAALVMGEIAGGGRKPTTIHKAIYEVQETDDGPVFIAPRPPPNCGPDTLVVVDEASMVGQKVAGDLREQVFKTGGKILWIGDKEQLQPVKSDWGVPLESPTGELRTVHRQALDSPILALATAIRTGDLSLDVRVGEAGGKAGRVDVMQTSLSGVVDWFLQNREDSVLLCWTNRTRRKLNSAVRQADRRGMFVEQGESIVCTANQYTVGLMNGSVFRADEVQAHDIASTLLGKRVQMVRGGDTICYVVPDMFGSGYKEFRSVTRLFSKPRAEMAKYAEDLGLDPEEAVKTARSVGPRLIQADWGYALTIHKAQGSQWPTVGVVVERGLDSLPEDERKRLLYTAVTRARQHLCLFSLR